jgi:hypothetical protein
MEDVIDVAGQLLGMQVDVSGRASRIVGGE